MAEEYRDVRIPLDSFSLAEAEKAICKEALRLAAERCGAGGSVAMAARFMKCSEARVMGIMREHGLTADDSQAKAEPGEHDFAGATRELN